MNTKEAMEILEEAQKEKALLNPYLKFVRNNKNKSEYFMKIYKELNSRYRSITRTIIKMKKVINPLFDLERDIKKQERQHCKKLAVLSKNPKQKYQKKPKTTKQNDTKYEFDNKALPSFGIFNINPDIEGATCSKDNLEVINIDEANPETSKHHQSENLIELECDSSSLSSSEDQDSNATVFYTNDDVNGQSATLSKNLLDSGSTTSISVDTNNIGSSEETSIINWNLQSFVDAPSLSRFTETSHNNKNTDTFAAASTSKNCDTSNFMSTNMQSSYEQTQKMLNESLMPDFSDDLANLFVTNQSSSINNDNTWNFVEEEYLNETQLPQEGKLLEQYDNFA